MVSVCYTHWFDSGYMFGAVYEAFWKNFSLFSCWAVGDDFRFVSVFCAELGSTAGTCGASVYEAFWKNYTLLLVVSRR